MTLLTKSCSKYHYLQQTVEKIQTLLALDSLASAAK